MICLHTVKGIHVFLFNISNPVYQAFLSSNVILIICLHTVKGFHVFLFNISNSVYQTFLSNVILIICLLLLTSILYILSLAGKLVLDYLFTAERKTQYFEARDLNTTETVAPLETFDELSE